FLCNTPVTARIHTLSLHDALPISLRRNTERFFRASSRAASRTPACAASAPQQSWPSGTTTSQPLAVRTRMVASLSCEKVTLATRSEEHTSELQSLAYLVCRLLLEK